MSVFKTRLYQFLVIAYIIFVSIFFIKIIIVNSSLVTDENVFADLKDRVTVTQVFADGASDRAGMLVGDIILKINNESFKTAIEADQVLRKSIAGSLMLYEIERKGQIILLKVQAANQAVQFNQIISIIYMFLFFAFAIFLSFKHPNDKTARYFTISIVLITVVNSIFLARVNINGLITIFSLVGLMIGFPLFFRQFAKLPRDEKLPLISDRISKIFIYVGIIFCCFTFTVPLIFNDNLFVNQLINILVIIFIFAIVVISIVLLAYSARRDFSMKIILLGSIYLPIIIFLALIASGFTNQIGFFSLSSFITLFVFIFYYLKYRFFKTDIVIKRNIQYQFSIYTMFVILVVIFQVFYKNISQIDLGDAGFRLTFTSFQIASKNTQGFNDRPLFLFIGILSTVLFIVIRRRLKIWLDKFFSHQELNYRAALSAISVNLAETIKLDELYEKVVSNLSQLMFLKKSAVFVLENNIFTCKYAYQFEPSIFDFKIESKELQIKKIEFLDSLNNLEFKEFTDIKVIAPLLIKDKCIGFFILGDKLSEENFSQNDFEFIKAISIQMAVSIENKRLSESEIASEQIKRDIELAKEIQINLLPRNTPNIKGLQITGHYEAALDIGGDYYDFLISTHSQNKSVMVVVGDVSGKGISASLYMSRFQGVMRSFFYSGTESPRELLIKTNEQIHRDIAKKSFVTCVVAVFDIETKTIVHSRAGHLPIIHFSLKNKTTQMLENSGLGLGLVEKNRFDIRLTESTSEFENGDIFILYSDGITEAMNKYKDEYGFDRLNDIIIKNYKLSSDLINNAIQEDIRVFVDHALPSDDITYVVVKIL